MSAALKPLWDLRRLFSRLHSWLTMSRQLSLSGSVQHFFASYALLSRSLHEDGVRLLLVEHVLGSPLNMASEGIPCPLPARLAEPFVQAKRCLVDVHGDADADLVP